MTTDQTTLAPELPTTETDAAIYIYPDGVNSGMVEVEFTRKMERQRDALREDLRHAVASAVEQAQAVVTMRGELMSLRARLLEADANLGRQGVEMGKLRALLTEASPMLQSLRYHSQRSEERIRIDGLLAKIKSVVHPNEERVATCAYDTCA